jgi:hypothetical protein
MGADKFRACYFAVYLIKKMVFGFVFGLYGGKEENVVQVSPVSKWSNCSLIPRSVCYFSKKPDS